MTCSRFRYGQKQEASGERVCGDGVRHPRHRVGRGAVEVKPTEGFSTMKRTISKAISTALLVTFSVSAWPQVAAANECQAYGARALPGGWNWHYPKETPNVRNGNRKLICNNGRQGWLYTRDDIPGRYFVADTNWVKQTRIHSTLCDAVAQYC